MKKATDIAFEESSGNVFADMGLPDADKLYAKTLLTIMITGIIKKRRLNPKEAAAILRIPQARLADFETGYNLSMDTLMLFLNRLGRDVEIRIERKPRSRANGEIIIKEA